MLGSHFLTLAIALNISLMLSFPSCTCTAPTPTVCLFMSSYPVTCSVCTLHVTPAVSLHGLAIRYRQMPVWRSRAPSNVTYVGAASEKEQSFLFATKLKLNIYWGTKLWNIDINFVVFKKQISDVI